MKIGVISDTHIGKNPDKLYKFLDKHMRDVDMLIHAGDYKNSNVVNLLKKYKKFEGVWGNVDTDEAKKLVSEKKIIEIENHRIGMFHGHGSKKTTLDRAYEAFEGDNVDIIIFGHSHQPLIKTKNGVLMLNPGSPTSKRKERWFSYIVLEINGTGIDAGLKLYKDV